MILCAHAHAGFHNESKGQSRAGTHIFVSKNSPFLQHNGPVLSISQIMKFVMSSAAKAELGMPYTTAKEMPPLRQTLIKMGWPQPHNPIRTDNSTAIGVTNLTIVPWKTKSMDLCIWWLRCWESQHQFVTTGTKAATIGQTTTPNTTCPSTTSLTDPHMQVQHAYYHLNLLPHSGPAMFSCQQTL